MRIVLIGGGGHASDILSILEAQACDKPVGLVADEPIDLTRFKHRNVTQWGTIGDLPSIGATHYVLAIGYSRARRMIAERLPRLNIEPLTLIHPNSTVHFDVKIGAGTVIMAGAVISAGVNIGNHGCVHHNAVIGHDCRLGEFVTVLPGATISGDVVLENTCLIGSGAVVIEKRTVGEAAIVGAGAVVSRDVPPASTVTGVPARVKRKPGS